MIGIYKIENLNTGDIYIGSSKNIKERRTRHFKDLRNGNHHSIILQRAFDKYSESMLKFQVVEECSIDELLIREQYFIDTLAPVYNICRIAGSVLHTKQSDEVRKKRSEYALQNKIVPPESTWRNKMKKVIMLDYESLDILQEFESASEACRFLGKNSTFCSSITNCCRNKRFSAFGYRWVFDSSHILSLRDKVKLEAWNKGKSVDNHRSRKVIQYSLDGQEIREWSSISEAENSVGKGISSCVNGKTASSNGFLWKFKL